MRTRLAGVDDPDRRIRILIDNHLRYFTDNMAEMKVMSHEAGSLGGEYLQRIEAKKRQVTEIVMDILAALTPGSELNPRVATFGLFGMLNWIYTWCRPGRDLPVDELVEEMTRLFLTGYAQASRVEG